MKAKRLWVAFLIGVFALGTALAASAATHTVTAGGDDGIGSMREAISKAVAGDVVVVSPTVKAIALKSPVNVLVNLEVQGNGATVAGTRAERLFNVSAEAKFDKLTFTKGMAFGANGGALNIEGPGAKADFVNCTFFDNSAGNDGGAVCVNSGNANATTFLNCTLAANSATKGGGVAVLRGIASFSACIVAGNTAQESTLLGAADVYAATSGLIFNSRGGYNVLGKTNALAAFPTAQGNRFDVTADKLFPQPVKLERANGVELLKLAATADNPAFNLIPTGSALGLPAEDQRGVARPQMGAYDAGAFEATPVALTALSLRGGSYIQAGKSEAYVAAVTPTDATVGSIAWAVSDATVIAVDNKGIVTGLKPGNAILTATAHGWDAANNPLFKQAQISIRVGVEALPAPQVTIQPLSNLTMKVGTQQNVTPIVRVTVAGDPVDLPYELSVFSSNPSVASANVLTNTAIGSYGRVVGLSAFAVGTTQITVSATARNSSGVSLTNEKTFLVTVSGGGGGGGSDSGGGGGGCSAGFTGLAVLLAAPLFLRKRK